MRLSTVVPLLLFVLVLSVPTARAEVVEPSSGKTLGNVVEFVDAPHFRMVSEDSVNGRPTFDYFLYVKAKLNGVFDIEGGLQSEETFNIGKIDVWGSDDSKRFWMDMHQSQLRLRGQRETGDGSLIGYMEGDFWGGSKRFRLRHLWFDYKFMHYGQDWTFFGDKEIWPNVFDWDGPASGVWRREPELRNIFRTARNLDLEIGVGQPGPEIFFSESVDETVTEAYQPAPDVIGAVNRKWDWGHIRVTGIYRYLKYNRDGSGKSEPGYGGTVSGYISTSKTKDNPVQFQFVGGRGIATYLVSFSGLNYDAAPDGQGNIEAIPTFGGWASYEHWFSRKWHGNLVLGYSWFKSHEIPEYTIPGPEYAATNSEIKLTHGYGLINFMYDPVPSLTLGAEWNIGEATENHSGTVDTGDATLDGVEKSRVAQRISFGAFFNF